MRKLSFWFSILVALALAGCLPQVQATPTLSPTLSPSLSPTPTATLASTSTPTLPVQEASTSTPTTPVQEAQYPDSGCTVITLKPTPGPTPESIYPPITDQDWVKGPASAKVTIIEYSDFQ